MEQRKLFDKRGGKEMHEEINLMLWAFPILSRERVNGKHVETEPHARGHSLSKRVDASNMALAPIEATGGCPATVSVHDNGDMTRNAGHVDVI